MGSDLSQAPRESSSLPRPRLSWVSRNTGRCSPRCAPPASVSPPQIRKGELGRVFWGRLEEKSEMGAALENAGLRAGWRNGPGEQCGESWLSHLSKCGLEQGPFYGKHLEQALAPAGPPETVTTPAADIGDHARGSRGWVGARACSSEVKQGQQFKFRAKEQRSESRFWCPGHDCSGWATSSPVPLPHAGRRRLMRPGVGSSLLHNPRPTLGSEPLPTGLASPGSSRLSLPASTLGRLPFAHGWSSQIPVFRLISLDESLQPPTLWASGLQPQKQMVLLVPLTGGRESKLSSSGGSQCSQVTP